MCFRCTFKAFGVILWHFKVVQMNQGSFFFLFLGGANYRAPWRDVTGAMAPLKSEGLDLTLGWKAPTIAFLYPGASFRDHARCQSWFLYESQ
jgi:hypothetical protein